MHILKVKSYFNINRNVAKLSAVIIYSNEIQFSFWEALYAGT